MSNPQDPYGVPTGGVPRLPKAVAAAPADPLLAVVDRQLDIEAKARAWDRLHSILTDPPTMLQNDERISTKALIAKMEELVHTAHGASSC